MKRRHRGRIALGYSLAVTCSLVFASAAGAANKPYSLVICAPGETCTPSSPAVVAPGSAFGTTPTPATMTATFKNLNKPGSGINLGSANLSVPNPPTGFSVTATDQPTCSPNSSGPCVNPVGGTLVALRNMNLAPGSSTTVTMSVVTPPPSTTSCTTTTPCLWSDQAKQSNDFNGTGNDLNLDPASALGTVTSSVTTCRASSACSNTLTNGPSMSDTIAVSSGSTAATVSQEFNYGKPYACQYSPEPGHQSTFWNVTGGDDRTKTVTDTVANWPGIQQDICFVAPWQFIQKAPQGTGIALLSAPATTAPDGGSQTWYIGVLPDCGSVPLLTVDPSQQPCVDRPKTHDDGITTTMVFSVPAGKPGDPTHYK